MPIWQQNKWTQRLNHSLYGNKEIIKSINSSAVYHWFESFDFLFFSSLCLFLLSISFSPVFVFVRVFLPKIMIKWCETMPISVPLHICLISFFSTGFRFNDVSLAAIVSPWYLPHWDWQQIKYIFNGAETKELFSQIIYCVSLDNNVHTFFLKLYCSFC